MEESGSGREMWRMRGICLHHGGRFSILALWLPPALPPATEIPFVHGRTIHTADRLGEPRQLFSDEPFTGISESFPKQILQVRSRVVDR